MSGQTNKGFITDDPECQRCRITDGKLNRKTGIAREHGTIGYFNGSEVSYKEDIRGYPSHVIYDRKDYPGSVSRGHTHPNEDKGEYREGEYGEVYHLLVRGPSVKDLHKEQPANEGFYNAMIDDKSIYFYNKGEVITISRSQLQSK